MKHLTDSYLPPDRYEAYNFCTPEHLSTHLDAPSHLAKGKWSVADIPLERLIAKG